MKSILLFLSKKAVKNTVYFLVACLLSINAKAQNEPIKILPLGNSITAGVTFPDHIWNDDPQNTFYSYRVELKELLDNVGFNYEFVGSQNRGTRHEGHPGWRSSEIVDGTTRTIGGRSRQLKENFLSG